MIMMHPTPLPVASDVGRGFVPSCYWHIDIGRNLAVALTCVPAALSTCQRDGGPSEECVEYGLFDCFGDGGICEAHILNRDHAFPRMISTDPSYALSTRA